VKSHSQLRWPVQQFLRGRGKLGVYTPENLLNMDKMIELENTLASWETATGIGKKHDANAKGKTPQ